MELSAPTTVGCNRYRGPRGAEDPATVWIRPAEPRDCFSDLAVAVTLDASHRIAGVDLTLSGP